MRNWRCIHWLIIWLPCKTIYVVTVKGSESRGGCVRLLTLWKGRLACAQREEKAICVSCNSYIILEVELITEDTVFYCKNLTFSAGVWFSNTTGSLMPTHCREAAVALGSRPGSSWPYAEVSLDKTLNNRLRLYKPVVLEGLHQEGHLVSNLCQINMQTMIHWRHPLIGISRKSRQKKRSIQCRVYCMYMTFLMFCCTSFVIYISCSRNVFYLF